MHIYEPRAWSRQFLLNMCQNTNIFKNMCFKLRLSPANTISPSPNVSNKLVLLTAPLSSFLTDNVLLLSISIVVMSDCMESVMMTLSNGNIFRVTGPLCGEFTGPGEFPTQRPVTRGFGVFFDLRLSKRLSKQPWGWWFETSSWSLWRQCNVCLQLT